eukprot:jgi/Tetstr1/429860/TSEL_019726.t1
MEPGEKDPLRDILDMSEYTGMVFGTVGEVSKWVRRIVRGVACLAADRGALSSWGTRHVYTSVFHYAATLEASLAFALETDGAA